MKCEKRRGWAIQGFKIMLMRKFKEQRISGWSVLKFENILMSPSKGQAGFRSGGINGMRKAPRVGDPRI